MKIKRFTIGVLLLVGLLIGGLIGGVILTGQPGRAAAAPAAQTTDQCLEEDDNTEGTETEDMDNVEEEVECGPQDENEAGDGNEGDGVNEAGDANEANEVNGADGSDEVTPNGLGLTADQAQAIVEAANPGVSTLGVEFDNENGKAIWEVELDNGIDVKVDANSGQILLTEARD